MTESGREALPDVREWSGDPPGYPRVVGGTHVWSVIPPGCGGVVRKQSRMSGNSRKALLNVREWLGVPPG